MEPITALFGIACLGAGGGVGAVVAAIAVDDRRRRCARRRGHAYTAAIAASTTVRGTAAINVLPYDCATADITHVL